MLFVDELSVRVRLHSNANIISDLLREKNRWNEVDTILMNKLSWRSLSLGILGNQYEKAH